MWAWLFLAFMAGMSVGVWLAYLAIVLAKDE